MAERLDKIGDKIDSVFSKLFGDDKSNSSAQ